ncbi:MAG: hypothetical protein ABJD24_01195 [Acidimicrobiales bacterium]
MFFRAHPILQVMRLGWLSLPLWAGGSVASGLAGASPAVRHLADAGMWAAWAIVLVALLVPTTTSLTVVRVLEPAVAAGGVIAAIAAHHLAHTIAVVIAAIVLIGLGSTAELGQVFVQGSAYGDEARFPLKPPAGLALFAVPVAWLLVVGGVAVGPALLAAKVWLAGALATVVGVVLAVVCARALHRLSRRFAVIVPAGLVLHDHVLLTDTVLFRRATVDSVGLAPADTTALDLTGGAPGLAVEVRLKQEVPIGVAPTGLGQAARVVAVDALLFAPSRPGRLLAAYRLRP